MNTCTCTDKNMDIDELECIGNITKVIQTYAWGRVSTTYGLVSIENTPIEFDIHKKYAVVEKSTDYYVVRNLNDLDKLFYPEVSVKGQFYVTDTKHLIHPDTCKTSDYFLVEYSTTPSRTMMDILLCRCT